MQMGTDTAEIYTMMINWMLITWKLWLTFHLEYHNQISSCSILSIFQKTLLTRNHHLIDDGFHPAQNIIPDWASIHLLLYWDQESEMFNWKNKCLNVFFFIYFLANFDKYYVFVVYPSKCKIRYILIPCLKNCKNRFLL